MGYHLWGCKELDVTEHTDTPLRGTDEAEKITTVNIERAAREVRSQGPGALALSPNV